MNQGRHLEGSGGGGGLDFGYKPREDKVITDIFTRGDRFFMTGDILRRDEDGFVYFCDRKADRYRWRGETVSTTGVEAFMSELLQLRDVVWRCKATRDVLVWQLLWAQVSLWICLN